MGTIITMVTILFGIVCVFLILIVLLQSGREAGMGLFGGESSSSVFGSRRGDILTKITTVLAILFMTGAFGLAILQSRKPSLVDSRIDKLRRAPASPAASPGMIPITPTPEETGQKEATPQPAPPAAKPE